MLPTTDTGPPYHEERRCLHQNPGLVSVRNELKVAEASPGPFKHEQLSMSDRRVHVPTNGTFSNDFLVLPAGLPVSPVTSRQALAYKVPDSIDALKSVTRAFKYTLL